MEDSATELYSVERAASFERGLQSDPTNTVDGAGDSAAPGTREFSLPPVDGGKDAWLFVAACFMVEALVWGFPFSFGVFQDYYNTHEPFAGSSNIAAIGTTAMGMMYMTAPLNMGLHMMFPSQGRWSPPFGLLVMCVAIATSSFATNVTHLIITQGVFFAIGGSITYCPCIIYLDEWFVRRKGLAYGIMWSGTGLAGVVLPLLLEALLQAVGFRTTLRIWSGVVFALAAPLAFYIKPRVPVTTGAAAGARRRTFDLRFLRSRPFLLYQLANAVEATGFFLPGIYLPSYARSALGAAPLPSALTVLFVNVASVFGCVAMGSLIDRFDVNTCILASTVGATVGTFLLWGFSTTLGVLYLYCIIYGLFAGSFTSAWPGIMREMTKQPRPTSAADENHAHGSTSRDATTQDTNRTPVVNGTDPSMVFAFLAAGRGVGNVVSGPLSAALVSGFPWRSQAAGAYGSGYGPLVVFTGVTALVGGGSYMWKRLGWL